MKKTKSGSSVLSKIAIGVVISYYILGIVTLIFRRINVDIYSIFLRMAILIPLILAIPNIVLNIIGIVKEKRVLPYLLCVFLPVIMWIIVGAMSAMYF